MTVARLCVSHGLQRFEEAVHLTPARSVALIECLHLVGEAVVVGTASAILFTVGEFLLESGHDLLLYLGDFGARQTVKSDVQVLLQFIFKFLRESVAKNLLIHDSVGVEPEQEERTVFEGALLRRGVEPVAYL